VFQWVTQAESDQSGEKYADSKEGIPMKSENNHESKDLPVESNPWRTLFKLATPFRGRILVIIALAALSTAATLIEPLIYRVAVNDVAGLFVRKAQEQTEQEVDEVGSLQEAEPPAAQFQQATFQIREPHVARVHKVQPHERRARHHAQLIEPHRRGHVSPRTPAQTLNTFIWAVGLMFALSIIGYLVWLFADNMSAKFASQIENSFIQSVFRHVLRLPLAFFWKRASGALAKQIDQADQVSPIVNAFTQTIVPETMTIVGASAIMVTQNLELTLIALFTLPPYLLVACS